MTYPGDNSCKPGGKITSPLIPTAYPRKKHGKIEQKLKGKRGKRGKIKKILREKKSKRKKKKKIPNSLIPATYPVIHAAYPRILVGYPRKNFPLQDNYHILKPPTPPIRGLEPYKYRLFNPQSPQSLY